MFFSSLYLDSPLIFSVSVPIEEILSVSKITGRAHGEAVVVVGFTVIYVKHKKNYILKQATVQFLGSSEDGELWTRKIEEALEKGNLVRSFMYVRQKILVSHSVQSNLFIPTLDTTTKFVIMTV